MKKQIKVIILFSILAVSLFWLVEETGAVTFWSTGASIQFPAIRWLDFGLIANNVLDGRNTGNAWPVFLGSTSDFERYTTLGCFIFNSTSSGLIYTAWTSILFDWYSHQQTGLNFYMTDTASWKLVTFKSFIPWYDDSNIPRQYTDNVMLVPLSPSSGWDYPSLWVICLAPTFTHVLSTNNMYLFWIKFSYYNWSTGNFWYDEFRYVNPSAYGTLFMNFDLDIHPFATKAWGWQTVWYFPYSSSTWSWYTYSPYQNTQLWENEFIDFLSGTGQYTNRTLPMFFASKNKITWQFVTWISWTGTSSSGTWSTGLSVDYFASCTWFLEVWCYIKGFFTGVYDTISWFFSSFFPDISFSWEFNSCGSWSFSSGTNISISQRFANVIAIINPIPPSEGTQICTIFWQKTISYQLLWPTENFFQKYIPWQVPALEIDPHIAYGQTIVDLITIFGMMSLIFYQKSKHD